ncbi:MAG: hypothetical protein ACI8P3_002299 [Saprospiraceae bacterium]|jgi:hypothetical protein
MKAILEKLENIQFDHSIWMNELLFAYNEIPHYEKRIVQLVNTSSNEEEKEQFNNLLNGFIVQKEAVHQLNEQIKNHVISMSHKAHANGELKSMIDSVHRETREKMETFRTVYAELKEKFHRLASLQD